MTPIKRPAEILWLEFLEEALPEETRQELIPPGTTSRARDIFIGGYIAALASMAAESAEAKTVDDYQAAATRVFRDVRALVLRRFA